MALEALKYSVLDSNLFTTAVTRRPRTYVQAYDICLEYSKLEELKATKAKETRSEPLHEARKETDFSERKHKGCL